MLRRLIAIMAAVTLLMSFVPLALAQEPTGYDNILYSNDFQGNSVFQGSAVGLVSNNNELNYWPENCNYAIVQEGENKYYKFSPNDTTKRSNSANPELGYFLKQRVAEKPVKNLKVEMDIAVTVADSNKVASIASYSRISSSYANIIEFNQTHFYLKNSPENKVSYTSGEWLHFTIYADHENNLCSVYVSRDGGESEAVFDDVQMFANARNNFTQIRLVIDVGASSDSSICVDNIVYSVTDEEMENIRYTNLNPTITDAKPYDYLDEIYSESFEGDLEVDSSALEYSAGMTVSVENGDASAASGKEQGDYVKLTTNGTSTAYFRMKYGETDSPVQSAASLSDLKQSHISFDICPHGEEQIYVTLYDKLSSGAEVKENIITISQKGYMSFSNSSVNKLYTKMEWMSFDIFADFETKTYTIYLNGNAVVKDVAFTTLTGCVEAVGFQIPSATNLYIDNIRMAIRKETKVTSTYPAEDGKNVSILDDVSIKLSNPIKNFLPSMVSVKAGDTVCTTGPAGDSSADCIVTESNGAISIVFPDKMQFETTYTITLSDTLTDCYNEELGEEYVLKFSTMLPQITYSVPVIGSSVTAVAVNPEVTPVSVTLVVAVVDSDGSGVIYKDTKEVSSTAPAELEVLYNASSAQPGQLVTAFLCDGENTLKPLRDIFVTPDEQFGSQGTSAVTAEVKKTEILGTTVTVEGKLSQSERQALIIKITDENNTPVMALPVVTDASGGFTYSYSVAGMAPGKYFAEITGYYVTQSNKKDYIYLSDAIKNEIKTAINTAANADSVKAVLASYKSKMTLEENCYNDNVYTVLFEQRPHESYDKLVEMIHKTGTLLAEINGADWTEYTKFFEDNESVVLYGETTLTVYNGYSDNQKNAINQIIVVKSPFADFKDLRSEFAIAVNSYTASLNDDDGGGSGGGGGGGSPSKVTSSYEIEPIAQEKVENTKNLFMDMSSASWAQESVTLLYEKNIISAAENYRPYDNVKREEFVKMLVELANIDTEACTAVFKDVSGNEWYAKYLGAAQKIGIINGSGDGSFGVGKPITRQDMVVMALRMVEVTGKSLNQIKEEQLFSDNEKISSYAAEAVLKMQRAGVISGMGNGNFEPLGTANRAQAAVIICNLIEALV